MMNEKKHERFIRIVERRMDVLINDFEKLGNCASKVSYDYTEEEVERIVEELERQVVNASLEKRTFHFRRIPLHRVDR